MVLPVAKAMANSNPIFCQADKPMAKAIIPRAKAKSTKFSGLFGIFNLPFAVFLRLDSFIQRFFEV